MSLRYTYTTMDRVFSKVERDLTSDFEEDAIIEWTGEALEATQSVKSFEEVVCFMDVKNFQISIPKYCHGIIQIARDNETNSQIIGTRTTSSTISDAPTYENPYYLLLGEDYSQSLDSSIPTYVVKYEALIASDGYRKRFTPVRLKNHTFFNTIVCKEKRDIYKACKDEYTIIDKSILRFSFEEGVVAIAYLRQSTDPKTGYPLIPDTFSHLNAIVSYIGLRMSKKDYFAQRQGSKEKKDDYEKDWNWYCKQASNIDLMPNGIDEHQDILDQRLYLLPRTNSYFSFFGNLAEPEGKRRY